MTSSLPLPQSGPGCISMSTTRSSQCAASPGGAELNPTAHARPGGCVSRSAKPKPSPTAGTGTYCTWPHGAQRGARIVEPARRGRAARRRRFTARRRLRGLVRRRVRQRAAGGPGRADLRAARRRAGRGRPRRRPGSAAACVPAPRACGRLARWDGACSRRSACPSLQTVDLGSSGTPHIQPGPCARSGRGRFRNHPPAVTVATQSTTATTSTSSIKSS